jgi:hypothetical protein
MIGADIMIDLETMGVGPTACIVAIGAVEMSTVSGVGWTFYRTVDLQSSLDYGGTITASTVMWWMQQSDDARQAICNEPQHLAAVLRDLSLWFRDISPLDELRVWGNGADFDLPILDSASHRLGRDTPLWRHWNARCYRTLKNLYSNIKIEKREGVHHNALDDAVHQATHWVEIMRSQSMDVFQGERKP